MQCKPDTRGWRVALALAVLPAGLLATAHTATAAPAVRAVTVAEGVEMGWAMAFLPGGGLLVTERPGRIRRVAADGSIGAPIEGVPTVAFRGQGGLLDLVLDSGFAGNRTLYFCFSEPARAATAPRWRARRSQRTRVASRASRSSSASRRR
jgi:aldose sugar dehydrogenase